MPKLNESVMKTGLILMLTALFIFPFFFVGAQVQIGQDIDGVTVGDNFGKQVKIAANGTILGVLSNSNTGNVQVYQNVGGNWELYGTDSEGGHFDGIVASGLDLSEDGHTLAIRIGGLAKVFVYDSGVWTQKGGTISMVPAQHTFGFGVCLSSDGDTLAMGATNYVPSSSSSSFTFASASSSYIPPPNYHGLVQIFKFESGNWNQMGNDIVANAFDRSAESYSLSSDGSRVAIANYFSIRIYEYNSGIWTLMGNEISGTENESKSVGLSSDGSTAAFGDPSYSTNLIQIGRVRIYQYVSNDWIQIGNDILGAVPYEFVGKMVSLSSDGSIVAISYNGNETNQTNSGQVRIFKNISGTWTQIGSNINGNAPEDRFGFSLNLSTDANTVAIGTPYNDGNGADAGHVRVYDLSAVLSTKALESFKFSLFPNPATHQFKIQLQEGLQLQYVNIYNALGQFLASSTNNIISTKTLSKGVYIIEIMTNTGKVSKKLVID